MQSLSVKIITVFTCSVLHLQREVESQEEKASIQDQQNCNIFNNRRLQLMPQEQTHHKVKQQQNYLKKRKKLLKYTTICILSVLISEFFLSMSPKPRQTLASFMQLLL